MKNKKKVDIEVRYISLAKEKWEDEGELEIDDTAVVSLSEDKYGVRGAYVQAWVWVDNPDFDEITEEN